jgi:DNA-binding beta-propeller fold protein YncE
MGKWRIPPVVSPGNPGPAAVPLTPSERKVAAEEKKIAEAIAAAEQPLPPVVPIVPPLPTPVIPPVPSPPEECGKARLYATSTDDLLYTLDPVTGEVLSTLFLDLSGSQDMVENFLATNKKTGEIYVSNYFDVRVGPDGPGNTVDVVSKDGEITSSIVVGEFPYAAGVDEERNLLYVPSFGGDNTVHIVDLGADTVIATVMLPDDGVPKSVMVDPATHAVYVGGDDANGAALWRIDPDTYQVTLLGEMVNTTFDIATPDFAHDKIYAAGVENGTPVWVTFDLASQDAEVIHYPGEEVSNMVYDPVKNVVYFLTTDPGDGLTYLYEFDHEREAPFKRLMQLNSVYGLDLDPERHILYSIDDDSVVAYDTDTWEQLFSTPTGVTLVDVKLGYVGC